MVPDALRVDYSNRSCDTHLHAICCTHAHEQVSAVCMHAALPGVVGLVAFECLLGLYRPTGDTLGLVVLYYIGLAVILYRPSGVRMSAGA